MADPVVKHVFLLVSLCLWLQTCHTSTDKYALPGDSLKPGDILSHTTQLCSASKIFCMYFDWISKSNLYYLMIYSSTSIIPAVWIGNPYEPVVNETGELTLDLSGELKILSQGKPIKVLYSPVQPINNTKAILRDNGNFVLQQFHPNGSTDTVLWQTFDYPTEVLLPEMKLGVNHKTGQNWSLASQVAYFNGKLTAGDFTLEWEPRNRELVILVRGLVYWKSGLLRNNKTFENIPEEIQSFYHFTIVSNEGEDTFTLTPRNKSNDKISNWVLTDEGRLYDGESQKVIARADKCYGFNEDGGCQKLKNMSTCWSPIGKFVEPVSGYINFTDIPNLELYAKNDTTSGHTQMDCGLRCWSNCECVGFYANVDYVGTVCTFLFKNALHLIDYSIHPDDDRRSEQIYLLKGLLHEKGKKRWIWKSVVIATSLLIICLFILCLALRKRKTILEERKMLDSQGSNESTSANDIQEEIEGRHDLKIFSYESIMEATNSFSLENKLGQGGFGPVYKGMLSTGEEIAVKRLSKTSGQGIDEFKNELTVICELQHLNLVQLLGCCIHKEERMLIYEYMPNKSLDFFLFDSTQGKLLNWQKRYNIIEGIAQGLLYLHKYSRLKIIHRDLKASNILLDKNMNSKISDFGMARMFTQEESKENTDRIVGTYGYMSPEYAMEGIFSTKSDIYSFGVLLLEIVSGKRNNSFHSNNCDGQFNLIGHAWDLWKNGTALQLMDPTLGDSCVEEEVLKCIHIGILCMEENADDRPTMSNIVSILTNKSATLSVPKRPTTLFVRRNTSEGNPYSKESNLSSIYEISLTVLDAR